MHWNEDNSKPGDVRQRKRFLFAPKTIKYETRWLESARWEERRVHWETQYYTDCEPWVPTRWLDEGD